MRRASALVVVLLVSVLVAAPAWATRTFQGWPFYVYQNVATGGGTIFIFESDGTFCGSVTLAGLGETNPNRAMTLAFETARDLSIGYAIGFEVPHQGVWYALGADSLCGGLSGGILNSYYTGVF